MLYTIGFEEGYDDGLSQQDVLYKQGRTEEYKGGAVWKTEDAAREACPSDNFAVYAVDADWEEDTWDPEPKKGLRHLVSDAEILHKCTPT